MTSKLLYLILGVICLNANVAEAHEKTVESGIAITCPDTKPAEPNQWIAFRKDIDIKKVPKKALARIACDSKYWLWINGKIVVFEGGLKRGPNRTDSYCDEVDISRSLRKGKNSIALLLWYFGKSGFSHVDSGQAQLIFDCPEIGLQSDASWLCRVHPAYLTAEPIPNYRLPESNILYDAQVDIGNWQTGQVSGFVNAEEIASSLGALRRRPIPQWKDFGVKKAKLSIRQGVDRDTIVAALPYNMQMNPIIMLDDADGGHKVFIQTDNVNGGSVPCIRAEYVTVKGIQRYENLGWMNGHQIHVIVPSGVNVKEICYRETGYDTEFSGRFVCDDPFFNRFWQKGLRTLYVNMRDTWFDCPDRERAQWWGDVTLLMAESFYTLSTSSHALAAKGIRELCEWQKPDGTLSSPIPGNYKHELPSQMLASVGPYGFWNYYMNTGDVETIRFAYPYVKRYLNSWKFEESGLTSEHAGGWNWGDWGTNKDTRLIQAAWYYLAMDSAIKMANLCGDDDAIPEYESKREGIKRAFNEICWTGEAYRFPKYEGDTDDRVAALAVVSGIAGPEKYPALYDFFKKTEYASPYMEKYVMEALFCMGHGDYAMERAKKRFGPMVSNNYYTTLWEGWGIGSEGFGGGTVNHAWSGGFMIVVARKLFGIEPVEPGFKTFRIAPVDGIFHDYSFSFESVAGQVAISHREKGNKITWKITIPAGTSAEVLLPGWEKPTILTGGTYKMKTGN